MPATTSSGKPLGDAAPVREQTHAIAGVQRHLRQRERGVDGAVQFAERPDPGPHQPSRVDNDPERLTSLDVVEPRHEAAASGARGPADVAQLVALLKIAEALERAPGAAMPGRTLLELRLPAADKPCCLTPRV